jgi:hypothetical protein
MRYGLPPRCGSSYDQKASIALIDNTRIAVKEITGNGERKTTEAFSASQSHYLFAAKLLDVLPDPDADPFARRTVAKALESGDADGND